MGAMRLFDRFAHDVFLSYAHVDNEPGTSGRRWVSDLHEHLNAALRQRMGARSGELSIFFDPGLRANQSLADLLAQVRSSAILLVVGSPSWIASDFCRRELETFAGTGAALDRCFVVEPVPLHSSHRYPDLIEQHIRVQFHVQDSEISGLRLPLTAVDRREQYQRLLLKVAYELADKLIQIKSPNAKSLSTSRQAGDDTRPARKRVLIADATDDLEQAFSQLSSSLQQFDVAVVEGVAQWRHGPEFAASFRKLLSECDLCVQLLGRYPGKRSEDHPQGLVAFQAEAAIASDIQFIQWCSPDLYPAEVAPEIRMLLEGEMVTCSSLSDFIQELLSRLATPSEPDKNPLESFLFIDADQGDWALAQSLATELASHDVVSLLPANSDDPAARLADLEDNLLDCNGLVLVYGTAPPTWVRSQLRQVIKLQSRRQSPLRPMLLLESPPQPKPDIGVVMPNLGRLSFEQDGEISSVVRQLVGDMRE